MTKQETISYQNRMVERRMERLRKGISEAIEMLNGTNGQDTWRALETVDEVIRMLSGANDIARKEYEKLCLLQDVLAQLEERKEA